MRLVLLLHSGRHVVAAQSRHTADLKGGSALKKLLNNPDDVAREAVRGLALAYPQYIRQLEGLQAVARRTAPTRGKVAVVGHEPMFLGYVGTGMADASV